mgnify:CR=1 FL=1
MTPIKRIVVWHTDTGRWSAWMADVWREDGSYERVIIDQATVDQVRRMIETLRAEDP